MPPIPKKYTFKVIFLGDVAVGKTSIVARYVTSSFRENYIPSIGANITSRDYDIQGKSITLMIWDIAAQGGFGKIRNDYYQGARATCIVYDVTRPGTFEDVPFWLEDLSKSIHKKTPITLVGNKIDLPAVVPTVSGRRLAEDIGADFIETSAKTGQNIAAVFDRMANRLAGTDTA